jgi:hypothetical protein
LHIEAGTACTIFGSVWRIIRLASAIVFWTEHRLYMGTKIEVERYPHIGDEPRGLWIFAIPNATFK